MKNEPAGPVENPVLPDLFLGKGEAADAAWWQTHRREEVRRVFEDEVYGRAPRGDGGMRVSWFERDGKALEGRAVRHQARLTWPALGAGAEVFVEVLVYLPAGDCKAVPVFMGLNFGGNHTVHADPGIARHDGWVVETDAPGQADHRATEAARGVRASRWSVEQVIERGYGLVTACCGGFMPDRAADFPEVFDEGVGPLFEPRGDTAGGALAMWAWGLSRLLDVVADESGVDAKRVAVLGHSRLGKAALWAGVCDPRFAMTISNDSGCGGAALFRRRVGESIEAITRVFPHWFCQRFAGYAGREEALPVDQHALLALLAPRPVYVASASEDPWADPRGEYLSLAHAGSVYGLFGHETLPVDRVVKPGEALATDRLGYHLRPGAHELLGYDWQRFQDFADQRL